MPSAPSPYAYDRVFYPTSPQAQTHPDRMAVQARLFGMNPAPIDKCRILELGCGDGGNLIPMAFTLPGSECVGIDLAETPIAQGKALIHKLELKNIVLRHMDILDAGADLGEFDYIIAQGVYAWVGPAVQEHLLKLCGTLLKPQGIALVSYNALPGGHLRLMVRDMMLYHNRERDKPGDRIERSRALLRLITEAMPDPNPSRLYLRSELERMLEREDSVLFHDELGEHYRPLHFQEFVDHAARHGLQYLAEAIYGEMLEGFPRPEVVAKLREVSGGDRIATEQYLDFVKCRAFRQTLLCRREVTLRAAPDLSSVGDFYIASGVQPDGPPGSFKGLKGATFRTEHPVARAAMLRLSESWPLPLQFRELGADASDWMASFFLQLYAAGMLEMHSTPAPFVLHGGERPVASRLARLQLERGHVVTNLRHASVNLEDAMARRFVQALDGTRDRAALAREMGADIDLIDRNLAKMGQLALLVA
jgi:SAM-dependent methyltransferase